MKSSNYFFIIFALIIVLCSVTIANCKFTKWKDASIDRMSESYLDMLENETTNIGPINQKKLIEKAYEKSGH